MGGLLSPTSDLRQGGDADKTSHFGGVSVALVSPLQPQFASSAEAGTPSGMPSQ